MRIFFFLLLLSPFLHGEQKNICLNIIIKNDEASVLTCLNSVKKIADCISVTDCGSTDQTRLMVENFLKSTGIPGIIHTHANKSYAETQVLSIQSAQKTIQNLGFPPTNTYILFLTPDQIVNHSSKIAKDSLTEEAYLALEQSTALSYYSYHPNLLKASLSLDFLTHLREHGYPQKHRPLTKLRNLKIEDFSEHKETATEEEKALKKKEGLERNLALFKQATKDAPDNERYYLYLAQSHKSLGQYDEAIECYKTRIRKEGNQEEIWFSKYMIGECFETIGKWTDALYWYLEAYQYNPLRSESIKRISSYYRQHGQNEVAYIFAKHGIRIPFQETNILFPMPALYDYQYDEEISITAFYTRFREDGYTAANDLILRRDTPHWIRDQGYRNILFYTQHLKGSYMPISIPLPFVEGTSDKTYNPMNPSIVKTKDGYKLICRAVNYTQVGAKHFYTSDPGGIFRTKNFLVTYDKAFNKISQHEIIEDLQRDRFNSFSVQGLEDCRIVEWNQASWFTCTTFDSNPSGAIQISLAKVNEENAVNGSPIKVQTFTPLIGPDPHRHEKNWLPFIKDGELYIVYNADPFVVYKPNAETGACETILEYTPEHDFSQFRGSAAPVPFDDGHVMLVHEVVHLADYSRVYLHRFVYLDHDFKIKLVSKPFTFRGQGVEFCPSMTVDHTGKYMLLTIGIEDREAWLLTVTLDEIRSMLAPLPTIYTPF